MEEEIKNLRKQTLILIPMLGSLADKKVQSFILEHGVIEAETEDFLLYEKVYPRLVLRSDVENRKISKEVFWTNFATIMQDLIDSDSENRLNIDNFLICNFDQNENVDHYPESDIKYCVLFPDEKAQIRQCITHRTTEYQAQYNSLELEFLYLKKHDKDIPSELIEKMEYIEIFNSMLNAYYEQLQ